MNTKELVSKYRHTFNTDYTADANCAAAWLFGEGSGTTLQDATANNRDGTFKANGEPAWSATVPSFATSGSALGSCNFDGSNDYIQVTDFLGAETLLSATIWAYFDTNNSDDYLFNIGAATTDGFAFLRDDVGSSSGRTDIFKIIVSTNFVDYAIEGATNSALSGQWYFVCFTFSSSAVNDRLRLYVNGVEDANSPDTSGSGSMVNPTTNLFIGAYSATASGGMMDGLISESAIFLKELTSTEVNEIYDYGLKGGGGTPATGFMTCNKGFWGA